MKTKFTEQKNSIIIQLVVLPILHLSMMSSLDTQTHPIKKFFL